MFFAADLHLASPQITLGMQQICGPIFLRLSSCLSKDSLSRDIGSLIARCI